MTSKSIREEESESKHGRPDKVHPGPSCSFPLLEINATRSRCMYPGVALSISPPDRSAYDRANGPNAENGIDEQDSFFSNFFVYPC